MNMKPTTAHAGAASRLSGVIFLLAMLGGCGRFYSAEIAGYIRDAEGSSGINGAEVRIYLEKPATAGADGFIAQTASMTSAGNAGYYNHKIIWQNTSPLFGEEGDSGTVWLGITREDYFDAIVEARGIISGTVNVLPDVELISATATVSEVTGRVVDINGDGIDGAGVSLDLNSTDDDPDYTATTGTVDGVAGTFTFQDVSWAVDQLPVSDDATEAAVLYIDDTQLSSGHGTDVRITLVSGQDFTVGTPITATYVSFSVSEVTGRVVNINGAGIDNVRVVLDLDSTSDDPDYVALTGVIDGTSGTYRFANVSWDDDSPDSGFTDTEGATIYVDDTQFAGGRDTGVQIALVSGEDFSADTPITATYVSFSVPEVTGRVVNISGEGMDNVRVVLNLDSTTTDPDYVTLTGVINGTSGTYRFANVSWDDDAPDSGLTDTEGATIYVDDTNYQDSVDTTTTVTLTSDQAARVGHPLVVSRIPPDEYSTQVIGRCLYRSVNTGGISQLPAQGVGVTLSYQTTDGAVVTSHTLYDQTDVNGAFSFLVRWQDPNPGDFDGPIDAGTPDPTIPTGEDGLFIQVDYDDPQFTDIDGGDPAVYDASDFKLKSWLDPTYLPDAVVTLP